MRHKHADLIIAWAEGAEIQIRTGGKWCDLSCPFWDSPKQKYRIKPREPRRFWVNAYPNDDTHTYWRKDQAEYGLQSGGETIEVVEVLEDE